MPPVVSPASSPQPRLVALSEALSALSECAHACRSLVDGLSPSPPDGPTARTVELGAQCAAACIATHTVLLRSRGPGLRATRSQLQECIAACTACAIACQPHALHQDLCRTGGDACRAAAAACCALDASLAFDGVRDATVRALTDCAQASQRVQEAFSPVASGSLTGDAVRLSGECAAACAATHTMLARADAPGASVQRTQLQSCIVAISACGTACECHASDHDSCRACADACRRGEAACRALDALIGGPSEPRPEFST